MNGVNPSPSSRKNTGLSTMSVLRPRVSVAGGNLRASAGTSYPLYLPFPATMLSGGSPSTLKEEALKNADVQKAAERYALISEFSLIQHMIPPGVYILPSLLEERVWLGTIFVRQGWQRGAIFRFKLDFPSAYPAVCPLATFLHPLPVHPLIEAGTGIVNLQGKNAFADWSETRYSSLHVICFLKRLFYDKDTFLGPISNDSTEPIHRLHETLKKKPAELVKLWDAAIRDSLETLYPSSLENPVFSELSIGKADAPGTAPEHKETGPATLLEALGLFSDVDRVTSPEEAFMSWFEDEYLPQHFGETCSHGSSEYDSSSSEESEKRDVLPSGAAQGH